MNADSTTTRPSAWMALKLGLRRWHRDRTFDGTLARLKSASAPPTAESVSRLNYGFGNEGWSATNGMLVELAALVDRAKVGVIECGSGVSTFILACRSLRNSVPTYSLEHHPEWFGKMSELLRKHGLSHHHMVEAPLVTRGTYDWYSLAKLPADARFDLVLCDGPPGDTRGGRYGMLPELESRMTSDCTIVLDDTHRSEESEIAKRWMAERRGWKRVDRERYSLLTRS